MQLRVKRAIAFSFCSSQLFLFLVDFQNLSKGDFYFTHFCHRNFSYFPYHSGLGQRSNLKKICCGNLAKVLKIN